MVWSHKEYYQREGKAKARARYLANRDNALAQAREYRSDPDKRKKMQYQSLRAKAKKASIPFDLSFEDLVWPSHCPILEVELTHSGKSSWNSPSIDKVVPELGYVKGNVRVISNMANVMKHHASKEQLTMFAANIIKYMEST